MEVAGVERASDTFSASLAGLQAGMIAALWMLAWMGLSAAWHRTSFWTAENLFATTFYGGAALHTGFSHTTLSGLALYLFVYSSLGGLLAVLMRNRLPRLRLALVCILLAIGWYYLSFHLVWKVVSPLVPLLHAEQSTTFGHLLYGALLARFPRYLPRTAPAIPAGPPPAAEVVDQPVPSNPPNALAQSAISAESDPSSPPE